MVHILVCRLLDARPLAAPRESVVRWMQGAARALEGIPTSVKDEDAIAGWPVTASSMLIKDNRATSRWSTSRWPRRRKTRRHGI
jgi:Asp-tRNA(Asn)/Glu-tRNA(Gln) amidotransferase A subunit family amidase